MGKQQDNNYILSEDFFRFIARTNDRLNEIHEYTQGEKLNMLEAHTVNLVDDTPGITVTQTAKYWNRTVGTISLRLKNLEKRGFIERKKEPGNDKEIHLFTTEKGRIFAKQHRKADVRVNKAAMDRLLTVCTSDEVMTFYKVMNVFSSIYGNESDPK
jgi:DNA-binding MarR family transcriptional regulator